MSSVANIHLFLHFELFTELKVELEKLFFSPQSEKKEFVINRYRDASQNLRTTFEKIVIRAGLEVFPSPFRNLRMTRSNEVYRKWGAFKESAWIGHSGRVRADHYLDITDDDFQEASEWTVPATGYGRLQGADRSHCGGQKSEKRTLPPKLPPAPARKLLHRVAGVQEG